MNLLKGTIRILMLSVFAFSLLGCEHLSKSEKANVSSRWQYRVEVTNLTDEEYPDNPDIGFRSSLYQEEYFNELELNIPDSMSMFNIDFKFTSLGDDAVNLSGLDISEFIPTIPKGLEQDEYLTYLSLVNQEWNRNQVRFSKEEFNATNPIIVRVDIARNCLNAYLWEIIAYQMEDGKTVPMAHGWFDFPSALYGDLFSLKNGIDFDEVKKPLENWVDPESKTIDKSLLCRRLDTFPIQVTDLSDAMYPVSGAREKKFKEIIYPEAFSTMRDLQTDSARFATFSPPGYYNRSDPRKTQLGRFYHLLDAKIFEIFSPINGDTLSEINMRFLHKIDSIETTLIIGGLDLNQFPVLSIEEANSGWKSSMGFANHSFYESYAEHFRTLTESNPYYAYLTDGEGNWLDSHAIGIDGPIFHFTDSTRTELHLWLLSFERHALVGHYDFEMKE
ncbi:MAG: hypothetical protein AAGC47_00125 [Bacteroidota bacterium]